MSLEIFKNLSGVLRELSLKLNDGRDEIEVTCANQEDCERLLRNLQTIPLKPSGDLGAEMIYGHKVRFRKDAFEFKVFFDLTDFRNEMLISNAQEFEQEYGRDFGVLREPRAPFLHKPCFFDQRSNQVLVNCDENHAVTVESEFFFSNTKLYVKFLHFLKGKEHKEDRPFYFVDYFSWNDHLVILTTAKKEGKLSLKFSDSIPSDLPNVNLENRFAKFFQSFGEVGEDEIGETQNNNLDLKADRKNLPKFIKAELFNFLAKEKSSERLLVWINKMDEIIEAAEQNFEIYLSDLSVENFKREYLDYKDKYFGQLREILGKITTQIIGLPLSVSAVALATYSIKENTEVIWTLIFAFVIYSFFAVFVLKLYYEDVDDIRLRLRRDFSFLDSSPFFNKYPTEKIYFDEVKTRIGNKVYTMVFTIGIYLVLLTLTNSILVFKLLKEVSVNPIYSVGFWFLMIITFIFVHSPKKRNSL